jgi:hypothetical protein
MLFTGSGIGVLVRRSPEAGVSAETCEAFAARARYELWYTQSMTVMTTIKVSAETRDRLKKLADAEQSTMEAALAKVLDEAEEARFWQGVKDDYARLQGDPEQWASYVNELAEWDRAVSDGLDDLE